MKQWGSRETVKLDICGELGCGLSAELLTLKREDRAIKDDA